MKKSILFFLLFIIQYSFGQQPYRIDKLEVTPANGVDNYTFINLSITSDSFNLPEEFKNLNEFSIFNVPFIINPAVGGKFSTTKSGTENLVIKSPEGTTEILFVMNADFPTEEISRSWELKTPLNVLSEPERALVELTYSNGQKEEMIPVNADFKCFGITHGRALYSVTAPQGKSIAQMILKDKMKSASFQIIAATANQRMSPRIAAPSNQNLWYAQPRKVKLSNASFNFNTSQGFSWNCISSKMLSESIDLNGKPVFSLVFNNKSIPSTEWQVSNIEKTNKLTIYKLIYNKQNLNLVAELHATISKINEITMTLEIVNQSTNDLNATLYFPLISDVKIKNNIETWYAYARNGMIINRMNCSFRDYLGCDKALQFDGIFNPSEGVGLAIFPRDTTDMFRYYNLGKTDTGVNYSLEYAPVNKKKGESWKGVPVAFAVVPGDWKDQFAEYKNWLKTWHKKTTPVLDWFKKIYAFAYFDNEINGSHDFIDASQEFKERFGYLDYLHIFGWARTNEYGHWGDYSHFESVGGKDKFMSDVKKLQNDMNIPVGLYLDGYLITDKSVSMDNADKLKMAIKQPDGTPFRDYNSYVECLFQKPWRDFLTEKFKTVSSEVGSKGLYCDELGMSLRARVCYDQNHGHQVPWYMSQSENELIKSIKLSIPDKAVYTEYGGTDVTAQFCDGGLTYVTSWNSYSPEWFNVTGNVPYTEIAPYYLDIRRFALPDFKMFDVVLTQVPWKDGNWSLGKFPFFNGNSYFHRVDEGKNGDKAALEMFRTIRTLQNEYKDEFSSTDVEPFIPTLYPNIFANRFSSNKRDVYTLFNENYRTVKGELLKVKYTKGSTYRDEWNKRNLEILEVKDNMATLNVEMAPREVICIVRIE